MKSKLLSLTVTLLGAVIPASAQQTLDLLTGAISNKQVDTTPTRHVEETNDGIIVTYSLTKANLNPDPLFFGSTLWAIDGFETNCNPEEPATLFRSDIFSLPKGASAVLTLGECEYKEYHYNLSPARQPLSTDAIVSATRENITDITPYNGFFPSEIAAMGEPQAYRGTPLQGVSIYPIQYDYENNIVRVYTKLQYKLTYDFSNSNKARGANETEHAYISPTDHFLNHLTINSGSNKTESPALSAKSYTEDAKGYLILTVPTLAEAIKPFAEWKKQLGFNTHIISRTDWTPNKIHSEVKSYYASHPELYYLLIIGRQDQVPAQDSTHVKKKTGSGVYEEIHYVTDFYYYCPDGDSTPDLSGGRIPTADIADVNTILNKIMDFEKNPPTDPSFYNNTIFAAYFEDGSFKEDGTADATNPANGIEDNFFLQTAESTASYLAKYHNKSINRVYYAEPSVNPTKYYGGTALPSYLKKPNYNWTGNGEDITNFINNGAFLTLYSGHGDVSYWNDPYFSSYDIIKANGLKNKRKTPIVFSFACRTGKFNDSKRSFAEAFLSRASGGCVGIVAATEYGYTMSQDALAIEMFNTIWPNPGYKVRLKNFNNITSPTEDPIYNLGTILNIGKARMAYDFRSESLMNNTKEHVRDVYHYFGDPSMEIKTETPTKFENVVVTRTDTGRLSISLGSLSESAYIALYDHSTNKITRVYGNSFVYDTPNPYNVDVCISAPNKIPYISQGPYYIQNRIVRGDNISFQYPSIIIGENVTETLQSGTVTFSTGSATLKANVVEIHPGTKIKVDSELHIEF